MIEPVPSWAIRMTAGLAAVICFTRAVAAQCEEAKLSALDAAVDDELGGSVAVRGARVAAGARLDDDLGNQSGSAYVFQLVGSAWVQQAKLLAGDGAPQDDFGDAIAMEGDFVFVGAPGEDSAPSSSNGAVYVYWFFHGNWNPLEKLLASDAGDGDGFGRSIDARGELLIVGAPNHDGAELDEGAAYVREQLGLTWPQSAKLAALDADGGDRFGTDVAIDGDYAAVGAPGNDDLALDGGAVYVFQRQGATWAQVAELHAADPKIGSGFGASVDLDGDVLVVGAPETSEAVYVFRRTAATWSQEAKLVGADTAAGDQFGCSVALSATRLAIGAKLEDDAGDAAGAAYSFEHAGGAWHQRAKLVASGSAAGDHLGISLDVDADRIAAGAFHHSPGGKQEAGGAFLFSASGSKSCLTADVPTVSVGFAGNYQHLALNASSAFGSMVYLLLGSTSGTAPGTPAGALVLPLNLDSYTLFTLGQPNQPPLSGSLGLLDAHGHATATFLMPIAAPALAGTTVHHAYAVLDLLGGGVAAVSNAAPLALVP